MIVLRSRNFWILSIMAGLYWAIAPWFPRNYVYDVVNSFSIAGLLGVTVMYYASVSKKTGSWLWVFRNDLSGAHYFVIGLLGLAIYIVSRHSYTAVWRWLDKPDWMIDSLFLAFLVYGTVVIAVMHLLSRDIEDGQIPRENWRWVGIFVAIATALAALSIGYFDPVPNLAGPALK